MIEVPHLLNILKQNQYDNIFHEHIGFHSLKSIIDLATKNNLKVFDVEKIVSQGGSIRCFICRNSSDKKISKNIKNILNTEKRSRLFSSQELKKFKFKIEQHSNTIHKLVKSLKIKEKKISVYGASGKGQG